MVIAVGLPQAASAEGLAPGDWLVANVGERRVLGIVGEYREDLPLIVLHIDGAEVSECPFLLNLHHLRFIEKIAGDSIRVAPVANPPFLGLRPELRRNGLARGSNGEIVLGVATDQGWRAYSLESGRSVDVPKNTYWHRKWQVLWADDGDRKLLAEMA